MREGEGMAASGGGLGLWFLPSHTVSAELPAFTQMPVLYPISSTADGSAAPT